MNILEKFKKSGNFVSFRGRVLHMRQEVYHSSMACNFVLIIVSAPAGTDNDTIKKLSDEIRKILLVTARNSSEIKKLPLWTSEEKQALSPSRKYRQKYKTCVEYVKKYVLPAGWRFYSTHSIILSEIDTDTYVKHSSDNHVTYGESTEYDYGVLDKSVLPDNTSKYLDFLISKNVLPRVEAVSCPGR